jgi:hypothetical protein
MLIGGGQTLFRNFGLLFKNCHKTMDLQFIIDKKGHKSAAQLPMKDWEQIQKDLDELERLRNKKLFMTELAEAVEEMKLIKEGKMQARSAEDFLNEL